MVSVVVAAQASKAQGGRMGRYQPLGSSERIQWCRRDFPGWFVPGNPECGAVGITGHKPSRKIPPT